MDNILFLAVLLWGTSQWDMTARASGGICFGKSGCYAPQKCVNARCRGVCSAFETDGYCSGRGMVCMEGECKKICSPSEPHGYCPPEQFETPKCIGGYCTRRCSLLYGDGYCERESYRCIDRQCKELGEMSTTAIVLIVLVCLIVISMILFIIKMLCHNPVIHIRMVRDDPPLLSTVDTGSSDVSLSQLQPETEEKMSIQRLTAFNCR